jgi:excisionase family DNA binding protein
MTALSYSLMEVADQLGFDKGKSGQAGYLRVYKMVARGQLRAFRAGRTLRVAASELDRLLASDARGAA